MDPILPPHDQAEPARLALAQYRGALHRSAVATMVLGGAPLLLGIAFVLSIDDGLLRLVQNPLFAMSVLSLVVGCVNLYRVRAITLTQPEDRYAVTGWFSATLVAKSPLYSITLAACFVAVAIFGSRDSIQAAALVKDAVREGELWRLLTAETLHGDFIHLCFNIGALIVLGGAVENLTSRGLMAVTFLLSAIGASLFSLALIPEGSIGSSGGIMGLAGFLLVVGYYRRQLLPGLMWSMLATTAMVALAGLLVFGIDSAAHLGGFLVGAMLAVMVVEKTGDSPPIVHERRWMKPAGELALGLLICSCAFSVLMRATR